MTEHCVDHKSQNLLRQLWCNNTPTERVTTIVNAKQMHSWAGPCSKQSWHCSLCFYAYSASGKTTLHPFVGWMWDIGNTMWDNPTSFQFHFWFYIWNIKSKLWNDNSCTAAAPSTSPTNHPMHNFDISRFLYQKVNPKFTFFRNPTFIPHLQKGILYL